MQDDLKTRHRALTALIGQVAAGVNSPAFGSVFHAEHTMLAGSAYRGNVSGAEAMLTAHVPDADGYSMIVGNPAAAMIIKGQSVCQSQTAITTARALLLCVLFDMEAGLIDQLRKVVAA